MSLRNKTKDNLKAHSGLKLVVPAVAPSSDDPLRFWTGHPNENYLVDLHEFATGSTRIKSPGASRKWLGPFSGRPELIAELAPAIQARLMLTTKSTGASTLKSLRRFWRVCDQMESSLTDNGRKLNRLNSVRDLNHLHEAAMHHANFERTNFGKVLNFLNDTRILMRLRPLVWTRPKRIESTRLLIPDSHAKALKLSIKRDWERVRKTWERHDAIRRSEVPDTLNEYEKQDATVAREYTEQNEIKRSNWLHFEYIQKTSGTINPTTDQLFGNNKDTFKKQGLYVSKMRAIAFPTSEEANIAFHAALMRSGWNPSTLITGIDATSPNNIFQHPKDQKQKVLVVETEETGAEHNTEDFPEFNMQGSKRRSGGRLQFCLGLKKDPDSPPNIVAAYLERTKELRAQLHQDITDAEIEYERLKTQNTSRDEIERHFKRLQLLQQGIRNVWLYVDYRGAINWLDGLHWKMFTDNLGSNISYVEAITSRLNEQRRIPGEDLISAVTPSDFRDIYARWVYIQSGGNILAVMLALGHTTLQSTDHYITNNIFSTENDDVARKFMTHLFDQLAIGRLDITILAQLVRHEKMTDEMSVRLTEYRTLTRSRIQIACEDIRNPPANVDPSHIEGKRCGTHLCLNQCPHARFLPESFDGISMRVEELKVISDNMSIDSWIKGGFDKELEVGEYLLSNLYVQEEVERAREHWREKIASGRHAIPGVGLIREQKCA